MQDEEWRELRGCTGKTPYYDVHSARSAARTLSKKNNAYMNEYECRYCSTIEQPVWHIGNAWPPKQRKKQR